MPRKHSWIYFGFQGSILRARNKELEEEVEKYRFDTKQEVSINQPFYALIVWT